MRDDAICNDLVQEVFLHAWTRAEQWDGHGAAAKAWLYRIATNLALNHLRAARLQIYDLRIHCLAETRKL